jgi:hypothetical protein
MKRLSLKFVVFGVLLATALANVGVANPILVYDVRIAGSGAKSATITSVGQVVNLEIHALITDSDNSSGNEGVVSSSLRFTSDESGAFVYGDLSNAAKAGAFTLGTVGAQRNYDSNPDMEWGGVYPGHSTTGYFNPMSSTIVYGGTTYAPGWTDIPLGTIVWTATDVNPGGQTSINAVPYVSDTTGRGTFNYKSDGVTYNNSANDMSYVGMGSPLVLSVAAPEPGTLTLLGVALAGLSVYTWRKRS